MTLQELIGELITLSQAYPDTTPVYVKSDERADLLDIVEVVSESANLEIHLRG